MAKYQTIYPTEYMDVIFQALADPTRRHILERLTHKNLTVSEIAKPYVFALPTISKHLTVLERAQLIKKDKIGRTQQIYFQPQTMKIVADYISFYKKFWNTQLDNLEKFLMTEVRNDGKKRS